MNRYPSSTAMAPSACTLELGGRKWNGDHCVAQVCEIHGGSMEGCGRAADCAAGQLCISTSQAFYQQGENVVVQWAGSDAAGSGASEQDRIVIRSASGPAIPCTVARYTDGRFLQSPTRGTDGLASGTVVFDEILPRGDYTATLQLTPVAVPQPDAEAIAAVPLECENDELWTDANGNSCAGWSSQGEPGVSLSCAIPFLVAAVGTSADAVAVTTACCESCPEQCSRVIENPNCWRHPCSAVSCGDHGVCEDGSCVCRDGYSGTYCDQPPTVWTHFGVIPSYIADAETAPLVCSNDELWTDVNGNSCAGWSSQGVPGVSLACSNPLLVAALGRSAEGVPVTMACCESCPEQCLYLPSNPNCLRHPCSALTCNYARFGLSPCGWRESTYSVCLEVRISAFAEIAIT